jgi:hypothetical protein
MLQCDMSWKLPSRYVSVGGDAEYLGVGDVAGDDSAWRPTLNAGILLKNE